MIIPDKIPIGGIDYVIEFEDVTEEGLANELTMGRIYFQIATIYLKKDGIDPQVRERSLVHEMLHGIFRAMDVDEEKADINEKFVDTMSYFLHQAITYIVNYNIDKARK